MKSLHLSCFIHFADVNFLRLPAMTFFCLNPVKNDFLKISKCIKFKQKLASHHLQKHSLEWKYNKKILIAFFFPHKHTHTHGNLFATIKKLSVSNASHVTLRSVDFNLNGNISCEVTTESPSFYTATATSVLQVVGEYKNDVIKCNIPAASHTMTLDLREKKQQKKRKIIFPRVILALLLLLHGNIILLAQSCYFLQILLC